MKIKVDRIAYIEDIKKTIKALQDREVSEQKRWEQDVADRIDKGVADLNEAQALYRRTGSLQAFDKNYSRKMFSFELPDKPHLSTRSLTISLKQLELSEESFVILEEDAAAELLR